MLGDLKNKNLILLKGFLFLALGVIAFLTLVALTQSLAVAGLALIAIWAFCRFYYFMFYVIEHYVDGEYRFAGIGDFVMHMIRRK